MYRLQPEAFQGWFEALNHSVPFPWQTRLFHAMLCPDDPSQARWPRYIGLPTASGKTSLIDLAVLALACGSPCARRRIVFVVDRRLVVDEAARRAERLAGALRQALKDQRNPLWGVSRRLVELGGDPAEPLLVGRLRGGIQFDESWARDPTQPAVILSTVDQVGSRLLFRAYGPSGPRAWPIVAGLLGMDTLFLIDEAHCARPFCETLTAIEGRWQHCAEQPMHPGIVTVQISATLSESGNFTLDDKDAECPTLARRLNTKKLISLTKIPSKKPTEREALETRMVEEAKLWLERHNAGLLAIIVNRVASARRIHDALSLPEDRKLLLTGRARPWERDRLLESWMPRLQSGRSAVDAQYAVVATQCVEVGADFDFDYMISEAASLDALRQRFGRLDRLGERSRRIGLDASAEPAGCLLALESQVESGVEGQAPEPDVVYGTALAATWRFLVQAADSEGRVDVSHSGIFPLLDPCENVGALLQPTSSAYPLLPAYLDLLAQTSPPPEPDVEISAFLHGTTSPFADVLIVWRADLEPEKPDLWLDRVAVQPPLPGEACTVPVWEARAWLAGSYPKLDHAHDLEEVTAIAAGEDGAANRSRKKALAWRCAEDAVLLDAEEVRPGDVLVVPSQYGGCTRFGWDPGSTEEVLDIGDAVAAGLGRRPVLRLGMLRQLATRLGEHVSADSKPVEFSPMPEREQSAAEVAPSLSLRAIAERMEEVAGDSNLEATEQEQLLDDALERLRNLAGAAGVHWLERLAEMILQDHRRELELDEDGRLIALVGSKGASGESQTATETAQFRRTRTIPLREHAAGVQQVVEKFAHVLDLPPRLRDSLSAAARFHDLGKWDPRFQAWLRGVGLFIPQRSDEILAKSGAISPRNLPAIRRARSLAGYPGDARHEALSAALAEVALSDSAEGFDMDLVLHLIASHHGYARPWFSVPASSEPILLEAEMDGLHLTQEFDYQKLQAGPAAVDRFWRLVRRYGWWGLAFVEAVLRLADHRRSEQEEVNA